MNTSTLPREVSPDSEVKNGSKRNPPITVAVLAAILLFLGFYANAWRVAPQETFATFEVDSESLTIGRLVETRERGLLSDSGLLGRGDRPLQELTPEAYQHQYTVFLEGGDFQYFSPYKSASGGQAMLLGGLQSVMHAAPELELQIFRGLTSMLMAATLALFIAWLIMEFGAGTAAFVAITSILSPWLTLFGRNLFYFIWASFLPLGLTAWLFARERTPRHSGPALAVVGFTSILFKCLVNGYDFIIPALAMPFIPLLYFAVRDRWEQRHFTQQVAWLLAGVAAAVALSVVILAGQLVASEGSFTSGLASIFATLGRRTYFADPTAFPEYAAAVNATSWQVVLWTYLVESPALGWLPMRFIDILTIYAGATLAYHLLLPRMRLSPQDRRKSAGLIAATWISFLIPISWFILFKGQAVAHPHTNFLAWHMPFTLVGYAMTAWLARCISKPLLRPSRDRSPTKNNT